MSGRVHRLIRKTASETAQYQATKLVPAINAAIGNEELTRKRVENLEEAMGQVQAVLTRPFLKRLKWLLSGR